MFKKFSEWIYQRFICEHRVSTQEEEEGMLPNGKHFLIRFEQCFECHKRLEVTFDCEYSEERFGHWSGL